MCVSSPSCNPALRKSSSLPALLLALICLQGSWPLGVEGAGVIMTEQYKGAGDQFAEPYEYLRAEVFAVAVVIETPGHEKVSIPRNKIREDIPFLEVGVVATPGDIQDLQSRLVAYEDRMKRYPKARRILEPRYLQMRGILATAKAGQVYVNGRWMTPAEYSTLADAKQPGSKDLVIQGMSLKEARLSGFAAGRAKVMHAQGVTSFDVAAMTDAERKALQVTNPAVSMVGAAQPSAPENSGDSYASDEGLLERKLKRIIVPNVQFAGASMQEVAEFLRVRSRDLDTSEANPLKRGVNIVLGRFTDAAIATVSLELRDVSMFDILNHISTAAPINYKLQQNAVVFEFREPPIEEVFRRDKTIIDTTNGVVYPGEPAQVVPAMPDQPRSGAADLATSEFEAPIAIENDERSDGAQTVESAWIAATMLFIVILLGILIRFLLMRRRLTPPMPPPGGGFLLCQLLLFVGLGWAVVKVALPMIAAVFRRAVMIHGESVDPNDDPVFVFLVSGTPFLGLACGMGAVIWHAKCWRRNAGPRERGSRTDGSEPPRPRTDGVLPDQERIFVNRGGDSLGTFSRRQIVEGVAEGAFLATDIAWQEGMRDWEPLSSFLWDRANTA